MADKNLLRMADSIADKYGIPRNLFRALVKQESGWNPRAGSHAGAQGLTQLMPATARGLGVRNVWDPAQNLEGGAKYLSQQKKKFGRWDLALSAYNSGPGGAESSGRVEGFSETQNYVKNILASLGQAGPQPVARGAARATGLQPPPTRGGLSQSTLDLIFGDSPDLLASLTRLSQNYQTKSAMQGKPVPGKPATPALNQIAGEFGPQAMLAIIRQAQKMGLSVRENPFTDKVDPVHTKGSHHYRNFGGKYQGKTLGRGADISGDPRAMGDLFKWVRKQYPGLPELIYDPIGSVFDGTFKPGAYGGHGSHVHVGL